MCGIIGLYVTKATKAMKNVEEIYKNQQNRGSRGAGCAITRKGEVLRYRNTDADRFFESDLKKFKKLKLAKGDLFMFHHRLPTSTANTPKANHPIANEDKTIYLIHNGIIGNSSKLYGELKDKHKFETALQQECGLFEGEKKTTYVYSNFTDSEVLVHLIEDGLNENGGDIAKCMEYVGAKVEGNYAIAFTIKGKDRIFLFKHDNPIELFKDKQGNIYFASETPKDDEFKEIRELKENELGFVSKKGYTKICITENPKIVPKSDITYSGYSGYSGYGGYKYEHNETRLAFENEKKQEAINEAVYCALNGMRLQDGILEAEMNWNIAFSNKMVKKAKRKTEYLEKDEDKKEEFLVQYAYLDKCYSDDDDDKCYYCGLKTDGKVQINGFNVCDDCAGEMHLLSRDSEEKWFNEQHIG